MEVFAEAWQHAINGTTPEPSPQSIRDKYFMAEERLEDQLSSAFFDISQREYDDDENPYEYLAENNSRRLDAYLDYVGERAVLSTSRFMDLYMGECYYEDL